MVIEFNHPLGDNAFPTFSISLNAAICFPVRGCVQRGQVKRLLARVDAFDQRQAEIECDVAYTYETLAHYIYYWLTRTEPIPEVERDIAHVLGQKRFEYFSEQVRRKVSDGA